MSRNALAGEQYLYCVLTPRFAAFMNLMAERRYSH